MTKKFLPLLILTIILSGCASPALPATDTSTPPAPVETKIDEMQTLAITQQPIQITPLDSPQMTPPASRPISDFLNDLIEQSKQDLAQRLSVTTDALTLVDAREVTWPNSSLGCPQPGMMYTEVLTPGFLIVLSDGNWHYEYHAGQDGEVFYCQTPSSPLPGEPVDR